MPPCFACTCREEFRAMRRMDIDAARGTPPPQLQ
jgi:hypothetical protein